MPPGWRCSRGPGQARWRWRTWPGCRSRLGESGPHRCGRALGDLVELLVRKPGCGAHGFADGGLREEPGFGAGSTRPSCAPSMSSDADTLLGSIDDALRELADSGIPDPDPNGERISEHETRNES